MPDWIINMDWIAITEAAATIALIVAAATPTEKDDGIVGRVANLARLVVPAIFRKGP